MRSLRWWQFGLFGAFVLSLSTFIKAIVLAVAGADVDFQWSDLPGFAAIVFAIGFLCGVIIWAGQGLYRRLGLIGDSIVGVVLMCSFFLCCMLIFEPAMLGANFANGGAPMLGLAVGLGTIAGPWFGKDIRKLWANRNQE
jgi:hypothetical protein